MLRKTIGGTLALMFVLGTLSGCANTTSAPENGGVESIGDTENAESAESGKKEVTLWHALTDEEVDRVESYAELFNEQSQKANVKLVYTPRDEMIKKLTIGNIAGDMADMVLLDNPFNAEFAASGVLEDLTEYYNAWDENQFLEGPLSSATYNERIYGLPYCCNCIALFYNEDMMEEAGVEVPETWEELKTSARELTNDEHFGFALCGTKDEEGAFQILPFINSAGGDINSLGSQGSIEAVQLIGDMILEGSISKEIMNWSQADVEKQFVAGNCAMMINGVWQVDTIKKDNPDLKWNVAYIPVSNTGKNATELGGENLCVTKGADVEACWEFVSWICGKEISPKFCKEMSRFSARSDVKNEEWIEDEVILFFANYMKDTYARVHPRWTECSSALQIACQKVYSGEATAAEAMKEAQKEVDAINAEGE